MLDRLGREVVLHDDRRVERREVDLVDPFVHPRGRLEHHPAAVRGPERATVFTRSASAFCHGTAIPWESAA